MILQKVFENRLRGFLSFKRNSKPFLILNFLLLFLIFDISKADSNFPNTKNSQIDIDYLDSRNELENYIEKVDLICLMGVHAGFGGQKFIEKTFDRLVELKSLIKTKNSSALIEIDGGVDNTNNVKLKSLGADVLVAGSYIFKSSDINKAISSLK